MSSPPGSTRPTELLRPLRAYRDRPVLVAVSGGADSVALLRALLAVGARPQVAHFDHRLRPESGEDAAFVAALAAGLGAPYSGGAAEVGRVAAARGWTLEQAARTLRYSFLTRAARSAGLDTILTAHTRRDLAETVLWQLLRGEAVLNGIPAERGHLRRPWLGVSRAAVEAYLGSLGQPWREDASNADLRHTRNWLRAEVLPLLEERFPGLEGALARLARVQAEDDRALDAEAARLGPRSVRGQPLALLRRYVRQQLAGQPLHAAHLLAAAEALAAGQTRHLTLPGGRALNVSGGELHQSVPDGAPPDFAAPPGWVLRRRQAGDRLPLAGGTRLLSDVLTDLKVPRAGRDRLWLLASERGVEWVGTTPPLWAVGTREALGQRPAPWHDAMGEALALAHEAARGSEIPVGAVVLDPVGAVVGRGRNRSRAAGDMTRHAELEALREAASRLGPYLSGCTLVVTLEPCPMCLGAAVEARVGRIVYGTGNPGAGALGGMTDLLARWPAWQPQVIGGVRAGEAARLLRQQFALLRRSVH